MADIVAGPDPTIHRRRLRNELRRAREAASRSQRDVATAMDWSTTKLIRIETGEVGISTNDLRMLLGYYGADSDRIEELVVMARAAREQARWSLYRDVASPEFISFLGYESHACAIRNFESLVIPGLLQTEEYARALLENLTEADEADALVDLRMQRQELLTRDSAAQFHFILDESVVHRTLGGREVMRRQLHHMRQMSARSNVTIQVVPFDCGVYPRMGASYVLFEFESPEDEDVLYLESLSGELLIRENSPQERGGDTPMGHLRLFWQLEQIARGIADGPLLDNALARLS
jgi:transcriptional regulator with XRE-family HTH domain